jgi:anti-sigma factor RsiW
MEPMIHKIEQLSEYLDGGLSAAERTALEAHVAACPECSDVLEDLRRVVERSRTLEDRAPESDLWPGIAARLEPRRRSLWSRLATWVSGDGRRFSLTVPQLAAVGATLVVAAAGITWWMTTQSPVAPLPTTGPSASAPDNRGAFASFDEARYDATVAELQQVLELHRAELDTSTVRVLEQNLAIIDRATAEAREALRADPANPYLHGHLAEQMKRKIRLLQFAAGVVTARGENNS